MGRTKDLFNEIVDMYENGYDSDDIAAVLTIPVEDVQALLDELDQPSANNVPY